MRVEAVRNVIIWGNHSATQFPDVKHAKVCKGDAILLMMKSLVCYSQIIADGKDHDAYSAVNDEAFLKGDFISLIQKRGAAIIAKRKLSSAMSAAKAACDHVHDWIHGTSNVSHI